MADTDQLGVFYVVESTRGVTPANPALQQLRVTGAPISISDRSVESGEMRADRQTIDYPSIAQDVSGELPTEFSWGNPDVQMQMAMCGTWANKPVLLPTAVTISAFTVASGGAAFRQGMLVRGSGFSNAANNGLFPLAADATGTSVAVTGTVAEPSPPTGARIKAVGFQAASGDCQAQVAPARLVITTTSGSWLNQGLVVGEWVRVGGGAVGSAFSFGTAGCQGWARISAITATTLTFDIVPPGWAADTGTGKTIRVTFGDRLDHGVTRRTMTVQRRFNDLSPVLYENSRGQEVGTMTTGLNAQAIATIGFGLMGDSGESTTTQISGATDVAATTGDVMTTGPDMGLLVVDGVQVGSADNSFARSLSLTVDNQLRQRPALNVYGTAGRGLGKLKIEGNMELYLENGVGVSMAQKAVNRSNPDAQFAWGVGDALGRRYLFDIPAAKVNGTPTAQGPNQDVMLPLTIQARRSATYGYMMRVQRYEETL